MTEYRVESSEEWPHSRFRTTHNWLSIPSRPEATEFDSNTRRTDDAPQFALEVERDRDSIGWDLSLVDPTERTMTYEFVSEVERTGLELEDRAAEVPFSVEFAQDRLFGTERETGATLQLEYGDGAAEDWEPNG